MLKFEHDRNILSAYKGLLSHRSGTLGALLMYMHTIYTHIYSTQVARTKRLASHKQTTPTTSVINKQEPAALTSYEHLGVELLCL